MHKTWSREHAATLLYGSSAVVALAAAIAIGSVVLGAVGVVLLLAALAALRHYPIDKTW